MARRLKYKVIDSRGRVVHHSFNKRNAQRWVRDYGKTKGLGIKRIRSKAEKRC